MTKTTTIKLSLFIVCHTPVCEQLYNPDKTSALNTKRYTIICCTPIFTKLYILADNDNYMFHALAILYSILSAFTYCNFPRLNKCFNIYLLFNKDFFVRYNESCRKSPQQQQQHQSFRY